MGGDLIDANTPVTGKGKGKDQYGRPFGKKQTQAMLEFSKVRRVSAVTATPARPFCCQHNALGPRLLYPCRRRVAAFPGLPARAPGAPAPARQRCYSCTCDRHAMCPFNRHATQTHFRRVYTAPT